MNAGVTVSRNDIPLIRKGAANDVVRRTYDLYAAEGIPKINRAGRIRADIAAVNRIAAEKLEYNAVTKAIDN